MTMTIFASTNPFRQLDELCQAIIQQERGRYKEPQMAEGFSPPRVTRSKQESKDFFDNRHKLWGHMTILFDSCFETGAQVYTPTLELEQRLQAVRNAAREVLWWENGFYDKWRKREAGEELFAELFFLIKSFLCNWHAVSCNP